MASLFTKISPEAASFQTLLLRRGHGISFEAGGRRWSAGPGEGRAGAYGATAHGTLGGDRVTLWLDEPDWRVAASAVLDVPPEAMEALPETLVRAALECFAADVLAALERAVGLPAALTGLDRGVAMPVASACRFALRRDDGLALGCAWTAADFSGQWRAAAERALFALPACAREMPGDLPLPGAVTAGMWRAPASALDGLSPGDVLLSPSGPEWMATVGRRLRFLATMDNGVLAVKGYGMITVSSDPDDAPDTPGAEDLTGVGNARVELQAQVGRLTVTLDQLRQLGTGQTVEFATPVDTPATLLVGGRAVATGELVDVGGRVGVRITAMAE